ncbi:MAG: xanthine dehydrogenase family protein molybdopterin-binding subunit, partial [Acidobacteriota bacterium]|nr:xanthine dehydrogenase family protein molybdopterin-binding subunit [Acidobacteriota bacterium]
MEQLIGKPIDRIDGRLKVTGRAPYAYEQKVPNAAYAVLITSTIARGTISAIDSQSAEKSSGVLLVMTPQNSVKLPQLQNQPPGGWKVQVLQDGIVRYANQPVGVVVADTLENAIEGARLVRIQYSGESPRVDLDGRLDQTYSPQKAGGGGDPSMSHRGDMQAGLSQANAHI